MTRVVCQRLTARLVRRQTNASGITSWQSCR